MSQPFQNQQFSQDKRQNTADFFELPRACNWTAPKTVPSASLRPAQRTVEVFGLPPDVSEDLVMNYFENVKRSKGGPVSTVVINPDSQKCLVTFESAEGKAVDLTPSVSSCAYSATETTDMIIFDKLISFMKLIRSSRRFDRVSNIIKDFK